MRNSVSESAMLDPSPPRRKIRLPENSSDPPSPTATPLKNPSRSNAAAPPKFDDSPNCTKEASNRSGSV